MASKHKTRGAIQKCAKHAMQCRLGFVLLPQLSDFFTDTLDYSFEGNPPQFGN
jgi:hypothetical protein